MLGSVWVACDTELKLRGEVFQTKIGAKHDPNLVFCIVSVNYVQRRQGATARVAPFRKSYECKYSKEYEIEV